MAMLTLKTKASVIATAAIVAFGITAYGSQADGHGNGAPDPTAIGTFAKAAVGGRSGCDIQNWPYIAPECLQPVGGVTVKAADRFI